MPTEAWQYPKRDPKLDIFLLLYFCWPISTIPSLWPEAVDVHLWCVATPHPGLGECQMSNWCFHFLQINTGSIVPASYSSSIFNFLRNLHFFLRHGCTNLHSHQQYIKAHSSPHPRHHLLFLVFLLRAVLIGMKWCLIVVLMCISWMISDLEHDFMYYTCWPSVWLWENIHFFCPCFNQIICFWC